MCLYDVTMSLSLFGFGIGAKSFTMVFSKSEVRHTCKITVHGNTLEQVDRFVYLGNLFTSDGRCEQDVRQRIAIAKSAFTSLEKVLESSTIRTTHPQQNIAHA